MKSFCLSSLALLFLVLLSSSASTQNYCLPDRFSESNYFQPSDILTLVDGVYGMAIDSGGQNVQLKYDLYMPNPQIDPLPQRPLIILVHGGSWQGGTKADQASTALHFAGKGYVCAAIDYRVGWDADGDNPLCTGDSLSFAKARLRALQDFRASMRYFAHFADSFKIDPNYFFPYGSSAGGGIVAETVYLSPVEIGQLFGSSLVSELGGADASGNSFTEGYRIAAARMSAPSMTDTAFVDGTDSIPAIFFHGTADTIVQYDAGPRANCANEGYGFMYGSRSITRRMGNLGLCYELNSEIGAPHGGLYTNTYLWDHATCFFRNVLCQSCVTVEFDSAASPCLPLAGLESLPSITEIQLFPNPVEGGHLTIKAMDVPSPVRGMVIDWRGVIKSHLLLQPGVPLTMTTDQWAPGLYFIRLEDGSSLRFVVQKD